MQVRLAAAAAITRARDATGPAWRALAQVAVGPDPVPAPRSPWHRRAALGLAGAAGAAIAAPLVGKIVRHDVLGSLHGIVGQYIPELYFQRIAPAWLGALFVLVALAGVLPMAMLSRPLLGWRLGWLALLAAPWTEARWLWFNRNFSWEFSDLGETAREAMTEMRRLLGVLRTGQAAEHAPQPKFADLPELVDAARDAGLAVELARHGPVSTLPGPVGSCAFRIVQESLSNAGRHAPGAAISVGVEVEPSIVRLKISNGPPALARNSTTAVNGHGHGLAGMRERVTLLGGAFSAGPTANGGFLMAAELPTREPA